MWNAQVTENHYPLWRFEPLSVSLHQEEWRSLNFLSCIQFGYTASACHAHIWTRKENFVLVTPPNFDLNWWILLSANCAVYIHVYLFSSCGLAVFTYFNISLFIGWKIPFKLILRLIALLSFCCHRFFATWCTVRISATRPNHWNCTGSGLTASWRSSSDRETRRGRGGWR